MPGRRRLVVLAGLLGVGIAALGVALGGDWQSVLIDAGVALALVGVLVYLEEAWKSQVEERVNQVEGDVDRVREDVARVTLAVSLVADAQQAAVTGRAEEHEQLISNFRSEPGPATLWAIARRCQELGLRTYVEVKIEGTGAMLSIHPSSETVTTLALRNTSGPKREHENNDWRPDIDLIDLMRTLDDVLVRLKSYPGDGSNWFGNALDAAADLYAARLAHHFRSRDAD